MFSQNYLLYTKCVKRLCLGMDTLNTLLQVYKVSAIPSHLLTTQCILSCTSKESKMMSRFMNDITKRKGTQSKIANKNRKTSKNKKSPLERSSVMLTQTVDMKTVLNSAESCDLVVGETTSDFKSLKIRCGVASREGDLQGVRSLSEWASKRYPGEFDQHLSFTYYFALAEFYAGQQSQALDRMASIMNLKKTSDGSYSCENIYSKLNFETKFTRAQGKKLLDTACLLLRDVPNIDDHSLWDQADTLVRSLSVHLAFNRPAYVLWKAYFFSHLHPEFERSDGLLARHPPARRYVCEKLKVIVQLLMIEPCTKKVVHLLQQLLKYRLTVALPPITSLLLSMHCQDGSSSLAVETFRFAYKLRIPLTSAVLVQFQQLLHQSRTPMPEELIKLKYSISTHKPGATEPIPWKF